MEDLSLQPSRVESRQSGVEVEAHRVGKLAAFESGIKAKHGEPTSVVSHQLAAFESGIKAKHS